MSDSKNRTSHIPHLSPCTVPRMQPRLFQNHERVHYLQSPLGWISTGPSQSKNLRELRNSSSFLRANITGRIPPIKVHKFGVRAYLLGRHHPFVPQLCPIQSRGGLDENASTYILSYIPLVACVLSILLCHITSSTESIFYSYTCIPHRPRHRKNGLCQGTKRLRR